MLVRRRRDAARGPRRHLAAGAACAGTAATAAVAVARSGTRGVGRSARRDGWPERWIYDAELLGGPGPRRAGADLAGRGQVGRGTSRSTSSCWSTPRPARSPSTSTRSRRHQAALGVRRGQQRRPAAVRRAGGGPRAGPASRGRRTSTSPTTTRVTPTTSTAGPRARQPRRQGAAVEVETVRYCDPAQRPARTRTRSGTAADGLRLGLRGRRRRRRPRADARRHRLQRAPLLLLPVGRDQRVAVRRVRRVRGPDQRRGHRHAGGAVAARRGHPRPRRRPRHGGPARVRRPRPDDEPATTRPTRTSSTTAACTPTAASTTRPRS